MAWPRGRTARAISSSYDSILDSVRPISFPNRQPAYRRLRELRQRTDDPLQLTRGLLSYSEKKELYVRDLLQIIKDNRLQKYDQYLLAAALLPVADKSGT
jgi:uncharacterized FlgJ-related protein